MIKKNLAKKIFKSCYIKGNFLLRSGLHSKEYFDKYNIESDPKLLIEVTNFLLPLIPKETEILAGLEMGGLPLVTSLSLKSHLPARFIRKKAKPYGTRNLCEGGDITGQRVCIIEDVITTGGQVIESVKELRKIGAVVKDVICIIYRGENLTTLKKEQLHLNYLFDPKELKNF